MRRLIIGKNKKDKIFSILLMLPGIIVICSTIFFPIVNALYMSFLNYKLCAVRDYKWNNFENYIELFKYGDLLSAMGITLKYMIIVVFLTFVSGLGLAIILNREIKARKFLRSITILPWAIPTVITALLWMWIFQSQYGVLNYILVKLNIIHEPIAWVTSIKFALISVIIASLWRQIPFMSTMMLAGLQTIPAELYEAALIDGANKRQVFFKITLPMLRSVIKSTLLISIITNFKQFPLFWIMTGGGPINKTTTLAILNYKNSFVNLNFGKGAAVTACWVALLVIFTLIYNKLFTTTYDD